MLKSSEEAFEKHLKNIKEIKNLEKLGAIDQNDAKGLIQKEEKSFKDLKENVISSSSSSSSSMSSGVVIAETLTQNVIAETLLAVCPTKSTSASKDKKQRRHVAFSVYYDPQTPVWQSTHTCT